MKKSLMIWIYLCGLLLLGGCWGNLPIESTSFVKVIGIDMDPTDPNKEISTYSITRPAGLAGGEGAGSGAGGPEQDPNFIFSVSESGFESTAAVYAQIVPRTAQLTHLLGIIISEERAQLPIDAIIERSARHPAVRPTVNVFVSDMPAQEVIAARPALESVLADALHDLIGNIDRGGVSKAAPLHIFLRDLLSPRREAVATYITRTSPILASVEQDLEEELTDESDSPESEIRIQGLAVFKGTQLAGVMTEDAARGAMWIFGEAHSSYSMPHPRFPDRYIGMTALSTISRLTPTVKYDRLTVDVSIRVKARMLESGGFLQTITVDNINQFEQAFELMIEDQVKQAFDLLQNDLGSDIFGIGDRLFRRSPKTWRQVEDRWDLLYREAEINVTADVRLIGPGFIQ